MDTSGIAPLIWLAGYQLALNAIGWWLAVRLLPEERTAISRWAAFLACLSIGLLITGQRGLQEERVWWLYNGVNVVTLVGFWTLRRGVERFLHTGCSEREQLAWVLPPLLVLALVPPSIDWAPLRTAVAYGGQAAVMLVMARSITPALRREFGNGAAWSLVPPMLTIGLVLLALAIRQLTQWEQAQELHLDTGYNQGVVYLYLTGSAMFGFGFIQLVALRLTHQLRRNSERDSLTQLLNRRALSERLDTAWRRHRRRSVPLALLMIDLDHFKAVNDTQGHAAGDRLLQQAAELLELQVRGEDLLARMGGEEFLVVLPDTDLQAAIQLAERLRSNAQAQLGVTFSLGLTMAHENDVAPEDALRRADAALYRAKAQGRNRVEVS
ncbi:MAG: GGDEF domain-containing protein [Burkholderiales bacterium]|nr:GGDEF domain-containing protein [Burkholderiales bacterium]